MPRSLQKNVRKLVALPPELAERVEKYRQASAATSDSDALKALIEDGLKLHDRNSDLFERCENATKKGQSIGEIINLLAADHPLVHSTFLTQDTLIINLKIEQGQEEQRFIFDRIKKDWDWERDTGGYNDHKWESIRPGVPSPSRRANADLDDEIPF